MQIAIVSRTGPALDAYTRFFGVYGVDLIHAPSLSELYQKLPDTPISGFVVEIHVMIKATETEKDLLATMLAIFPSVKTNWNPEAGFRALYNDSDKSGEENLRAFVRDCHNFKPRALRKKKRHEKTFNVLYWPVDASQETAQRAFTLDISTEGLFVGTLRFAPGRQPRLGGAAGGGYTPLQGDGKVEDAMGGCHAHPGIWRQFRRSGSRPRRKIGNVPDGKEGR